VSEGEEEVLRLDDEIMALSHTDYVLECALFTIEMRIESVLALKTLVE
jgi:hypothetical protein